MTWFVELAAEPAQPGHRTGHPPGGRGRRRRVRPVSPRSACLERPGTARIGPPARPMSRDGTTGTPGGPDRPRDCWRGPSARFPGPAVSRERDQRLAPGGAC
jgi:hypothetical protein